MKGGICLLLLVALFCLAECGKKRVYYLKAEDIYWDYAPGVEAHTPEEKLYLDHSSDRIGRVYKKCVYRRYTDDSYKHRHPEDDRSPGSQWEHLGTLGPVMRAVVGDTVIVHFKNTCDFPATVHPHGLQYDNPYEGAYYLDKDYPGNHVAPGDSFTYKWHVPQRSGPTKSDTDTIGWLYHSHVSEPKDTTTGLAGLIIVGRDEESCPDGYPKVDRELVTLFTVTDETISHYFIDNILQFTDVREPQEMYDLIRDSDFIESNKMHGINSYLYFTLPGLTTKVGDLTRWYVVGLGSEVDIHTAHWHGNTLTFSGSRKDVFDVFPAIVDVGEMVPDTPGMWMYHCHVNDHIDAGMVSVYTVDPADDSYGDDDGSHGDYY